MYDKKAWSFSSLKCLGYVWYIKMGKPVPTSWIRMNLMILILVFECTSTKGLNNNLVSFQC